MKKRHILFILVLCMTLLTGACFARAESTSEAFDTVFSDPQISTMIDAAAEEAREVGWSELCIPFSAHHIGNEAISENALAVGKKLIDAGYQAYLTGGAVRDMILGTAVSDFDIASDAPQELWETLFGDALSLHNVESSDLLFGVVKCNGEGIDLAPLQNIPAFYRGRPGVPETDPDSPISDSPLYDSYGRDLTINAMYYDLSNGDILDYHGGLRDIQDKVLRTIGDPIVQLGNGPSEMIRYIRFHARYEGSSFAPELEAALEEHHLDYARLMAPLNAQNQLRRLWINGYAVACFDLMQDYGLVGYFYCPVAELCDTEAYQTEVRAALGALDAAYAGGESVKTYQGTAALLLPAGRERLKTMELDAAVESLLKEMDPVYGFYGSERDDTAQCLRELLSAEQQDGAGDEAA